MAETFVLMTALPPTLGHADLINFSAKLATKTTVLVVTRPEEPYRTQRVLALQKHFEANASIVIRELAVKSTSAESNAYWAEILKREGFQAGDYLCTSELWGTELAFMLEGEFYPYDLTRELRYTKATSVRDDLEAHWGWVLPEFQAFLQKRIVIFGAESIGKTTLTKALAENFAHSLGVFEYARPYLEITPGELDHRKMEGIWRGQKALQETVAEMQPKARVLFHDTDLYSTLGYWQFWDPATVPPGLEQDALESRADLYVLLNSNIPFEADPIRYGGDKREQTDAYWRSVLEKYELPYVEVKASSLNERIAVAAEAVNKVLDSNSLNHERTDSIE